MQWIPANLADRDCYWKLFCNVITVPVAEPFDETEEKWLSSLENTRWLEYIRLVPLIKYVQWNMQSFQHA